MPREQVRWRYLAMRVNLQALPSPAGRRHRLSIPKRALAFLLCLESHRRLRPAPSPPARLQGAPTQARLPLAFLKLDRLHQASCHRSVLPLTSPTHPLDCRRLRLRHLGAFIVLECSPPHHHAHRFSREPTRLRAPSQPPLALRLGGRSSLLRFSSARPLVRHRGGSGWGRPLPVAEARRAEGSPPRSRRRVWRPRWRLRLDCALRSCPYQRRRRWCSSRCLI